MQTRGFFENFEDCGKWLILLAPRAGFEPATIRLTVECSTAELPRNRRNQGVRKRQRITKPPRLAKDEIARAEAASIADRNCLRRNDLLPFLRSENCDLAGQTRNPAADPRHQLPLNRLIRRRPLIVPGFDEVIRCQTSRPLA